MPAVAFNTDVYGCNGDDQKPFHWSKTITGQWWKLVNIFKATVKTGVLVNLDAFKTIETTSIHKPVFTVDRLIITVVFVLLFLNILLQNFLSFILRY
jgi:hypothetical protein